MDIDEHWKHSNRRQVVKVLEHLLDARKAINLSIEHSKLIGTLSESCGAVEGNIDAISIGLNETIKLCGIAADEFKSAMLEPNAIPAPIVGKFHWIPNLSPMQRALMREGLLDLPDTPGYVTPKQQARAPSPLPFTLKRSAPKKSRKRTKENIPL